MNDYALLIDALCLREVLLRAKCLDHEITPSYENNILYMDIRRGDLSYRKEVGSYSGHPIQLAAQYEEMKQNWHPHKQPWVEEWSGNRFHQEAPFILMEMVDAGFTFAGPLGI